MGNFKLNSGGNAAMAWHIPSSSGGGGRRREREHLAS